MGIRSRAAGFLGLILLLSACNVNNAALFPTVVVVAPPTNTLAPIITQTQRFTATPIPTSTPIPLPTVATTLTPTDAPTATNEPATPTLTPFPAAKAVIKLDANLVNLRAGPGSNFRIIGSLKAGSAITVLVNSTDQNWSLVRLDDGTEGWMNASMITLANPGVTVPALSTLELTQRAQLATAAIQTQTAAAPTSDASVVIDSGAPTHAAAIDRKTDVLAYCDWPSGTAAERNRKFTEGQRVYIFWSWIATTPEQMKDHLNNAIYTVKVNGQVLGEWAKYSSKVTPLGSKFVTYWFVPIGTPASGTYRIEYNVTWKAAVNDGTDNYGPGTDKPSETYTCSFTVSK